MNCSIFSLRWQNIDGRVAAAQQRVFAHLGVPLIQHCIHGFEHGEWMDWVLHHHKTVDLFLFVDADAFPVNKQAVQEAFEKARDGYLYGNAQVSSHIDPNRLFVGPSWCAISRNTWISSGCPSARTDTFHDVAQRWSDLMPRFGVKIEMLRPKRCIKPLWKFPDGADFGIGTTFESASGAQTFHMFGVGGTTYQDEQFTAEVRMRLLEEECNRICAQAP